ncbi:hypothetical protein DMH17_12805 [Raoultella planticola]|nr:hypothetical protein [Raoultella planticola]
MGDQRFAVDQIEKSASLTSEIFLHNDGGCGNIVAVFRRVNMQPARLSSGPRLACSGPHPG